MRPQHETVPTKRIPRMMSTQSTGPRAGGGDAALRRRCRGDSYSSGMGSARSSSGTGSGGASNDSGRGAGRDSGTCVAVSPACGARSNAWQPPQRMSRPTLLSSTESVLAHDGQVNSSAMTDPDHHKTREIMVSPAIPDCERRAVNQNPKPRWKTLPPAHVARSPTARVSWVLFHTGEEF